MTIQLARFVQAETSQDPDRLLTMLSLYWYRLRKRPTKETQEPEVNRRGTPFVLNTPLKRSGPTHIQTSANPAIIVQCTLSLLYLYRALPIPHQLLQNHQGTPQAHGR